MDTSSPLSPPLDLTTFINCLFLYYSLTIISTSELLYPFIIAGIKYRVRVPSSPKCEAYIGWMILLAPTPPWIEEELF